MSKSSASRGRTIPRHTKLHKARAGSGRSHRQPKAAVAGVSGEQPAGVVNYLFRPELLALENSHPDEARPTVRLAEMTMDVHDIRQMTSWFPASGFMTVLTKELASKVISEGGSDALEEFGIVAESDLGVLNEMQGESVLEIMEALLSSLPEEWLTKRFGQQILFTKQIALGRNRRRARGEQPSIHETVFIYGCSGKRPYSTEAATVTHIKGRAYLCDHCRQWHRTRW